MSIDTLHRKAAMALTTTALAVGLWPDRVKAQDPDASAREPILQSPIAPQERAPGKASGASDGASGAQFDASKNESPPPLTPGQGPGVHSPLSPFKPLQERKGIVSWKVLSAVKPQNRKGQVVPKFSAGILELKDRVVKVQGFMMPLEAGDKQSHFLLSAVPPTCSFCVPAGPEGLIEIYTTNAVRYTLEPVVIEGKLLVLEDDPYGLFYRVSPGKAVED